MPWEALPWICVGVLGIAAAILFMRSRAPQQVARLRNSERMAVAVNASLMRVTEQLEARERQLRAIADNLPVLIVYVDREQVYRFANEAVREFLGAGMEQVIGRKVEDVMGAQGYGVARPHIEQALSGYPVTYERTELHDGKPRHLRATYLPDYTAEGRVEGFHAMEQDITAATEAEAALRAGEERLRMITDSVPVLIGYIDRDHVYRFNNRTYEAWFGRRVGEITGRPVAEVIGQERFERFRLQVESALAGREVTFEYEVEGGGGIRNAKATFVPDVDRAGNVRGIYTVTQDITAAKQVEAELARQARFDLLTGLPNRLLLQERLDLAQARSQREAAPIALLYLDLDHFKTVNDTHGHGAGDVVLREFGRRLGACVRRTDTVARLAGDEFVVLLEGLKAAEEAELVARKIVAAMHEPIAVAGQRVVIGASIGIAVQEDDARDANALLARADAALYRAKACGRNTYVVDGSPRPPVVVPAPRSRKRASRAPGAAPG